MRAKQAVGIIIGISHIKKRKEFTKILDQKHNIEEIRIKVEEVQKE